MGWPGLIILGAAVGGVSWGLHPLRRASRVALWMAMLVGVVGAVVAHMAGNVIQLFHDGDTLEWPVCTAIALVAVAVTVGLFSRR